LKIEGENDKLVEEAKNIEVNVSSFKNDLLGSKMEELKI